MQQGLPAVQQNPAMAPLVLSTLKWLVTGFKDAQYLEGELDAQLTQIAQMAAKGQQPQAQPNPATLKAQAIQQKTQADVAIAKEQENTKRYEAQLDAATESKHLEIAKQQADTDAAKVALEAHDAMMNTVHDHAIDQLEIHDKQKNTVHNHAMDIHSTQPQPGLLIIGTKNE